VIVAVAFVLMVQVTIHEVIDVIAMGDAFMPAAGTMPVIARMTVTVVPARALVWIVLADGNCVFGYVAALLVVQMPVVQIIDVTFVANRGMATSLAVLVIVALMGVLHRISFRVSGAQAARNAGTVA
jgi:hypothetical protein